MKHIAVVRAKLQPATVSMAQNGGHFHAVDQNRPMRINVVELTKVGGNLARLLVDLVEVVGVCQTIFTDLKLNPAVVA